MKDRTIAARSGEGILDSEIQDGMGLHRRHKPGVQVPTEPALSIFMMMISGESKGGYWTKHRSQDLERVAGNP